MAEMPPPVASSAVPSSGSRPRRAVPEQSLRMFKLLEALRSYGDPTKPIDANDLVSLINDFPRTTTAHSTLSVPNEGSAENEPGPSTPLHLAVQCARLPAVNLTLQTRPSDINARNRRGQTPLHLACLEGRTEVVAAFLACPEVDDQIKDNQGHTCLHHAKSVEVANLVQVSRAQLNATFAELLLAYASTHVTDGPADTSAERQNLVAWISRPRARGVDFGTRAPGRGTTILHEAARRRDLDLIKMCHAKGADLVVRDAKGKLPSDMTKDERVKAFLRSAITAEGRKLKTSGSSFMRSDVSISSNTSSLNASGNTSGSPPYRSGYLAKWVNMAKGYGQRWFVLQHGMLTYYRHQDDEGKASRGSVSLAHAKITGPHNDKLKFEITSSIVKSGKWYLKANHPLEAIRWVEDIKQHIEYVRGGGTTDSYRPPISRSASGMSGHHAIDDLFRPTPKHSLQAMAMGRSDNFPRGPPSIDEADDDDDAASIFTFGDDPYSAANPPHEDSYMIVANGAKAQLEATELLLDSFGVSPFASQPASLIDGQPGPRSRLTSADGDSNEIKRALQQSLRRLGDLIDEHLEQASERERWYSRRYEREMDAKRLWEETTRQVAAEQAEIEEELRRVARDSSRRKKALRSMRMSQVIDQIDANADEVTDTILNNGPPPASNTLRPQSPQQSPGIGLQGRARGVSNATMRRRTSLAPSTPTASGAIEEDEGSDNDSDSEEFFETIDSNNIPLSVDQSIARPERADMDQKDLTGPTSSRVEDYEPYKSLRTELPIKADNRPPISLWAVLKGSIGKDLTKISFPVYFNEPTSMLQRMAEDMEFSECLDAAVKSPTSVKRIAYVAAFAMSNYSSTQGRIAKPFNALLSETFEYARFDKHYRYISEQVSHHPPISACIGESPDWRYFGEVDAKSKFTGKSFEIRPTGNAHAMLYLPKEWCPRHPPDTRGGANAANRGKLAVEHYSWRKVTTSVSNFIMGSPQIDHFGDMEVTNHVTGEKCILTFKPRGWRGKDAYEIKGHVLDPQGQVVLEIAGRWNSQLIARRPGLGQNFAPDTEVGSPMSPSAEPEYFLLWRNSVKPPGSPFNLTPFAITLNGVTPELREWLPPTDCRLRPDQHFFEAGKFEKANDLKAKLEEHQRDTRRKREKGEVAPHAPRWFTRKTEPDTKEGYWEPNETDGQIDYWLERGRVGEQRRNGANAEWSNVLPIFGQYADLVSVE